MELKHDTIRIFLEQATMLYAFECARRRKNEAQKPSWTQSGGQDGVFRGANTGLGGPKRGSKLPIPGPKTEGMQNQRTKAPKERLLMHFLKAPATEMNQKGASERAPEGGSGGVFLVQNRKILLKKCTFPWKRGRFVFQKGKS